LNNSGDRTHAVADASMKTRAMLSQGEQRDAAVNFNAHRILQRHRAVSLPQHGFLAKCIGYICDRSDAEITIRWFSRPWHKIMAIAENHGTQPKCDREYVII